ncbi:maleylpyruvate isomerase family mycothiol-dependent enzyme [Kineococcus sp. SYSU DK004]|uniref:maleylpyruvate isomerase family mycothiol-dependent enzyme n=1 Tax=Kineococcus sp. SYSU DK004 TaxID=3383125 RepID=UPI003D7EAFC5
MHDASGEDAPLDHLAALGNEQDAVLALLDHADLDAPVPHCAPWRVRELAAHLAEVHRWAAATSRLGPDGSELPEQEPPAAVDPVADYAAAAHELRAALGGDPARACRTLDGAGTVAWWRRRQLHEVLVHRWDLQDTLGLPRTADEVVARDCVAEVVDTLHPRQVRLGRVPPARTGVVLRAPGATWVLGDPARLVAHVDGPAGALAQLLWRRTGPDDPRLVVAGDRSAALALLGTALTP